MKLLTTLQYAALAGMAIAKPLGQQQQQQVIHAPSEQPVQLNDGAHHEDTVNLLMAQLSNDQLDPIAFIKQLEPHRAHEIDEPRFIQVFGESEGKWLTEGHKIALRREGKQFIDLTGRHERDSKLESLMNKKRSWPKISHEDQVRSVFPHMTTHSMHDSLEKLTSFYSRYYRSETGRQSYEWLFKEILKTVANAPSGLILSVESVAHPFQQSSIIARFTPEQPRLPASTPQQPRNTTFPHNYYPTVVVGAHQDSANYLFPLLPAPGADDDGSGTVTILEAFKALVERGYKPLDKVVEFHWYAAEEAGLLGSLDVVDLMVGRNVTVDAMIEFDMTAYVKKGTNATISIISTDADPLLSDWVFKVASEYCDEPVRHAELIKGAGSDYMSFTKAGFSSSFVTECDPMAGEFDPYIHTIADRMDLKDGVFSFEHMLEFAKLTVGFVVEQAGWNLD